MDQKDKVDLSSVNKTKKQFKFPNLANPLKKNSAGPGRDQFGQFATGGLRGKSKWMNWKVMTAVILLVTAIGGFYVYKSNASELTAFNHGPAQMSGGDLVQKSGGTTVRYVKCTQFVDNNCTSGGETITLVSEQEMKGVTRACAYILSGSGSATLYFRTGGYSWSSSSTELNGNPRYVCVEGLGTAARHAASITLKVNGSSYTAPSAAVARITGHRPSGSRRSLDAFCKIDYTKSGATYTLKWSSEGIDTSEADIPVKMHLKNVTTNNPETVDLPLSGSRTVSPQVRVSNLYTLTLFEGEEAADPPLSCSVTIPLGSSTIPTPPPSTTPACDIAVTKSGSVWTARWSSTNLGTPKNGNWDATLTNSATGNTTNNVGVNGSRQVSPRVGYSNTYTLVLYDGWAATGIKCSDTIKG